MARRPARARSTAVRVARPPLGRALPLASGVGLLAGLAVYASTLRSVTFLEAGSVLAIGAAIVATVVALTRPAPVPDRRTFPLPVRSEPTPTPRVDSAFVCAKCDSYAAPPDWEALLREFEPSKDLEGRGDEKPHLTPGAAAADPVWPRWPIPAATAEQPAPPPGLAPVVDVAGRWTPYGWDPERAPALIDSETSIEPALPASWAISGARRLASDPPLDAETPSLASAPGPVPPLETPPVMAPEVSGSAAVLVADFPSLDQWISDASAGLVARASRTEIGTLDEPIGSGPRRAAHCAHCRTDVTDLEGASRCTDCRRPFCDPCEGSLLEHGGERFCSPCAINRLGSDLLRTLEEPVAVGGPGQYARSGARRARPRRSGSARSTANRTRGSRVKPAVGAVTVPGPIAQEPAPGAAAPPTGPSAAPTPPTNGIPDPVL